MAKRISTLPLALPPRPTRAGAVHWLVDALRHRILAGQLRPGQRLPASRDLAAHYRLARGTVVSAFEQLAAEGYVVATVGSGTRVSEVLPDDLLRAPRANPRRSAEEVHPPRRLSRFARQSSLLRGNQPRPLCAFRANEPALDRFPTGLWAQVTGRRLRRLDPDLLVGCDPAGYRPLREAVADYLRSSRGVSCEAEQVLILSGSQEALDLASRILIEPGDRVALEEPGYPGARRVFTAHGAKIVDTPVDADGVVVDAARWRGVRLAYLTPAHQYPLGIALSLARRLELLDWARQSGAILFEDDYDSEFRYAARPLPALQGLDRHGVVCFAGSFSKVLFPSLRLGYLVVPPALVEPFSTVKSVVSRHAPLLDQAILTDFLTEGHFGRHLRRMREIYSGRLSALLDAGREHLAGRLKISPIEAGLQTVGWLAPGLRAEEVERAAAARGVEVIPLSRFTRSAGLPEGLQLGFAAVEVPELRRGVRELARVLDRLGGDRRGSQSGSLKPPVTRS
ncbi:MAG: PLP-dependent aminotransferase family protein [Holophagales bacterium]|nr:MAG: PLP-dependent aminotransferase family protein [Holophagales bacterium]